MGGSGKRAGSVPTVLVLIILFLPQVILCVIYLCSMETNGVGVLIFFSSLPYSFLITVSRCQFQTAGNSFKINDAYVRLGVNFV